MKTPKLMKSAVSAKQLAKNNPALAGEWAKFIHDNKAALVKQIAGKVSRK